MDTMRIKTVVEELLGQMTISIDSIEVVVNDIHPIFSIRTRDSGILIGNQGETLRALNYIVKKMVESRLGEEPEHFLVDVNGYHERRIKEIRDQAKMLAERARMFQYDVEMHPMNAYERLIVHSAFTDDPDIETESHGEGKFRRVVLKYKAGAPVEKSEVVAERF